MRKLLGVALILLTMFVALPSSYAEEESKDKALEITGFVDFVAGIYGSYAKVDGLDSYMNLYLLGLNFDGKAGIVGYHATVLMTGTGANVGATATRNFSSYANPIWLEEGYVYFDLGLGSDSKIKIGSVYNPFGMDGDNSWYYQYHYYAGMSIDADYGMVGDFNFAFGKMLDLRVALGLYLQDDDQNGSRNAGQTDISIEGDANGFEERTKFVGRIAPTFKFGKHSVALGLSAMFGDIKANDGKSKQYAYEADLDANLVFGKLGVRAFGEIIIADRNTRFLHGTNKKYTLWLTGGSVSYDVGGKVLSSIDLHANYGFINRRGSQGTTTDSDLMIIGSAIGFGNLTMTLEYVFGKNDVDIATSGNRFDDVFIIDFFYEF